MKKVVLALVLAFSSNVALSSEVGAQNPQTTISTKIEVAVAETGTSYSWARQSERKATAHQLAEHMNRISVFDSTMNSQLEAAIERKLLNSLKY